MVGGGHPSYLSVSFNRLVGCIPCYVQYAIGIFDNCGSGMDFSVRWHNFGVVGPVDSSVFRFREHWSVAIRRAAVSTWKVGGVGAFPDYEYFVSCHAWHLCSIREVDRSLTVKSELPSLAPGKSLPVYGGANFDP